MELSQIISLTILAILLITTIILVSVNLYPYLFYSDPITKSVLNEFDTIIVLGYPATKEGKPSPIMRERVIKAVELFNKGYAKNIICSGGDNKNQYREADIMAELAKSLGVPESCLIKEDRSMNTYSNLVNSIDIMKNRNWSSAVVVTSPWHLRRSSYLLSKFNITYVMKKSDYPREFSIFFIALIYMFENYIMTRNKILFH